VDNDYSKVGRELFGLPVIDGGEGVEKRLQKYSVQEVVFALPALEPERIKELYERYKKTGCSIKVYDYPTMQTAENGKRHMREFDIEELLFRKPVTLPSDEAYEYYKDKVVMITGGGGSIGSELCRQIARMKPSRLIILDVYENGAYDIQQELRIAYGNALDVRVEIVSVCDRRGLERIFGYHKPQIILHAAAHKHVPLMEHNCCEAVKNNVFGTLNVVELAEKYGVERFTMVSTDKAVNPTNVMGATKRMCEMIVQSHSRKDTSTTFSATRFGNVLGSAASVVPLFKKQIMNGGPVTVTDKRIIRYFMTIPEASQLVLQSGAMAKNGELFVLDMGKSIKILELAETMIRLSGYETYRDIDIIETGLRPGEKLYEELLIRTEELDRTENSMIFIERDTPLSLEEISEKLLVLRKALESEDDTEVKKALMQVVPTYTDPSEFNPK
jgi:FlaA1/EpsC-like NDP-sugar epimerase